MFGQNIRVVSGFENVCRRTKTYRTSHWKFYLDWPSVLGIDSSVFALEILWTSELPMIHRRSFASGSRQHSAAQAAESGLGPVDGAGAAARAAGRHDLQRAAPQVSSALSKRSLE